MRYPHLIFEVSIAQKDLLQKDKLKKYLAEFVPKWMQIENEVMMSFEKVTGRSWPENKYTNIKATFIASGVTKSHPLELHYLLVDKWSERQGAKYKVKDFETQAADLIHELCHIFPLSPNNLNLIRGEYYSKINDDNLSSFIPKFKLMQNPRDSALIHIYIQNLWRRVMHDIFPKKIVDKQEERAREITPIYTESYRILDSLSRSEKQNLLRGVISQGVYKIKD